MIIGVIDDKKWVISVQSSVVIEVSVLQAHPGSQLWKAVPMDATSSAFNGLCLQPQILLAGSMACAFTLDWFDPSLLNKDSHNNWIAFTTVTPPCVQIVIYRPGSARKPTIWCSFLGPAAVLRPLPWWVLCGRGLLMSIRIGLLLCLCLGLLM